MAKAKKESVTTVASTGVTPTKRGLASPKSSPPKPSLQKTVQKREPAKRGPPAAGVQKKARASSPRRLELKLECEKRFWAEGFTFVCGTDEAGRGTLAGPVVAAAFAVLNKEDQEVLELLASVNDSKVMSAQQREEAFKDLTDARFAGRVTWGIAEASVAEIDKENILKASLLAMTRAVRQLDPRPDCVLVDGCNRPPDLLRPGEIWTRGAQSNNVVPRRKEPGWLPKHVEAVIDGDAKVCSIAAASVLAKVHRDALMTELDKQHPEYGFALHKGYGTKAHMDAIKKNGVSKVHRRSFAPVQTVLNKGSLMRAFTKGSAAAAEGQIAAEEEATDAVMEVADPEEVEAEEVCEKATAHD